MYVCESKNRLAQSLSGSILEKLQQRVFLIDSARE